MRCPFVKKFISFHTFLILRQTPCSGVESLVQLIHFLWERLSFYGLSFHEVFTIVHFKFREIVSYILRAASWCPNMQHTALDKILNNCLNKEFCCNFLGSYVGEENSSQCIFLQTLNVRLSAKTNENIKCGECLQKWRTKWNGFLLEMLKLDRNKSAVVGQL